ncbi:DUF1294 domain-containing protein [Microbacterium sp. Leaf288]|uniref:DUF1294 domain-containing protein n=1 Tax=Microbacterium sp. Leaf288 TaxID=1736323 RepID=UPI0009E8CD62|nr:DUF1294 domain-containing protein [Microbacterium sp. Leaf288]
MPNPRPGAPLATPERPGRDLSKPLPAALSWITLIVFAGAFAGAYFVFQLAWWVPALYGAASVVAFAAYGIDKAAARRQANRISEQTLLILGLIGGWPGALVAQQVFRHKTRKRSFRRAFWGTVGVNVLVLAAYVYLTAPALGS